MRATCAAPTIFPNQTEYCFMRWPESLSGVNEALEEQLDRPHVEEPLPGRLCTSPASNVSRNECGAPRAIVLNGLGGFHQGGREYVTLLGAEQWTTAPCPTSLRYSGVWISDHGERGGNTWSVNSRENRLRRGPMML